MLQRLTYGKFYTAIEHAFVDGKEVFYCTTIEESKKTFTIVKNSEHSTIKDCSNSISKKQPISLIINNQYCLFKVVNRKFETAEEAAKFCFPTLTIDDFYIEITNQENTNIVSICRKETVEQVLEYYRKKSIIIADFSLGNSLLTNISQFLNEGFFQNSVAKFSLDQKKEIQTLESIKPEPNKSYNLNELEVFSDYLLGFSAILGFYAKLKNNTHNFSNRKLELLKNYWQHRIYRLGTRSSITFLFLILLINSLVFFNYQNLVDKLNKDIYFGAEYRSKLELTKTEIELKKGLINNLSVNTNSLVSLYLDEIGASIPKSILLTNIDYQPLLKKPKEEKEILFESNKMAISGTSSNGKEFTMWIRALENTTWIKSCQVVSYGTGKQTTASFTIQLSL